jgi:phage terminase large subunit-like protein
MASRSSRDYRRIADKYATEVVEGKLPICKWVRLATARYLKDRDSKEFILDNRRGKLACEFIEKLPHVKGRWAAKNELFKLEPWQVWIVFALFASVRRDSELRRFRQAYICVPRKNGKSPLAAAIGLYMMACEKEVGAEVYCGATSEKQAWEVFRPAKQMAANTPELLSGLHIKVHAKCLTQDGTGSRFEPVIGKPGDGASVSCGIADEFHEATDATLFDAFNTGMVGRQQPLLLIITTAGTDIAGPCHDFQVQAQHVLEGVFQDDQLFAAIYGVDDGDDWTTEAALRKANPNLDISVNLSTLRHDQAVAVQNAAKANVFKTKHLNIWCNVGVGWMNLQRWNACADPNLKAADFTGAETFVGVDLASKIDMAAAVKLCRKEIDGKTHYYVFPRFYLPAERALSPECQHYQKWVAEGRLTATEGNVIDYNRIQADLETDIKQFRIRECGFDPYNATQLMQSLAGKGLTTVEIPQNVRNLSEPMKQLEAIVLDGRLHHDGNPALTWMIANVVAHLDANDNIYPRKDKPESKIDGVVALIMALGRAIANVQVQSPYGTRGLIVVG